MKMCAPNVKKHAYLGRPLREASVLGLRLKSESGSALYG